MRGIYCRLRVTRGAVDVAVEAELQIDAHGADGTRRGHFGDIGETRQETRAEDCRDNYVPSAGLEDSEGIQIYWLKHYEQMNIRLKTITGIS
jgi:hypothetical protein